MNGRLGFIAPLERAVLFSFFFSSFVRRFCRRLAPTSRRRPFSSLGRGKERKRWKGGKDKVLEKPVSDEKKKKKNFALETKIL